MKKRIFLGVIGVLCLEASIPAASKETGPIIVAQPQTDKELAWVDEQIQAILPARIGISDGLINSLRDPIKLKKPAAVTTAGNKLLPPPKLGAGLVLPPKVVEEPLRLTALMNKSAFISGKWYKTGDAVRDYSLSEVKPNSVLLTGKKGQKLILFLTKQNNNIKITTK